MKKTIYLFLSSLLLTTVIQAKLVDDITENLQDCWDDVSKSCQKVESLMDELPSLPDHAWFSTDKKDQLKKIRKYQNNIREELLSIDTQVVLYKAEKINKKIVSKKKEILELKEKRGFVSPEKKKKIDISICDEQEELQYLEASYTAEMDKVKKELASIGLNSKSGNLGVILSMSDRADIINNVILAKSIGGILSNLCEVLKDGDSLAAKRYYGVYVTLADIHILCYEQYLEKSRYGEWRHGLDRIETNAVASIETANNAMESENLRVSDCDKYRKAIFENNQLIAGVQLYRKLLDSHENAIEKKLTEVRKQRTLAKTLYDTVSGAVNFKQMLQSSQEDFSAVMELELPEIAIVDSSITEEQLNTISKMLDMN